MGESPRRFESCHFRSGEVVIAVDFDKTIADYGTWEEMDRVGEPLPGAIKFLRTLSKIDDICILSARAADPGGLRSIKEWVDKYGLSDIISRVSHEKLPDIEILIDDRAIHFDGDFRAVLKEVVRRKARHEKRF